MTGTLIIKSEKISNGYQINEGFLQGELIYLSQQYGYGYELLEWAYDTYKKTPWLYDIYSYKLLQLKVYRFLEENGRMEKLDMYKYVSKINHSYIDNWDTLPWLSYPLDYHNSFEAIYNELVDKGFIYKFTENKIRPFIRNLLFSRWEGGSIGGYLIDDWLNDLNDFMNHVISTHVGLKIWSNRPLKLVATNL